MSTELSAAQLGAAPDLEPQSGPKWYTHQCGPKPVSLGPFDGGMDMPRISVVVPAFNEREHLPRLLESIAVARKRYFSGEDEVEVIVADNASTDETAIVARRHGCRVVRVEKRSIAAARNGGARACQGEVVAFVDADSQVHPETFNAIEDTLASGRVVVGATGFRYDRMSLSMWLQFLPGMLILYLARLDTGVVFCRRADWEAVGGFQEDRLVAEDIQFQTAMKRLGRTRGQRFARAKGALALSSSRKFDRYGDWHYVTHALGAIRWLVTGRGGFARFIKRYWYEERQ